MITLPEHGYFQLEARNTEPAENSGIMSELIVELAKKDSTTHRIAQKFSKHKNDLAFAQAVANYVYERTYFEADPPKIQILRTPFATLRDQAANCVDYTIFMGAVCLAKGIPVVIRIVKFAADKNFSHVYPLIDRIPVDLVIGQNQHGLERQLRQRKNYVHFGNQVDYFAMFDTPVIQPR